MNDRLPCPRSPELLCAEQSGLLVVDVQEKLVPLIPHHERMVFNIGRLVKSADLMSVPTFATEQYPRGLGPIVASLKEQLGDVPEKQMFSCRGCEGLFEDLGKRELRQILVVGIETHVCIGQTVFDLLAAGFAVFVAVDAVGSRYDVDRETALRRMDSAGATLTTTEAAMFEWCETADKEPFKQLSQFIQQPLPE